MQRWILVACKAGVLAALAISITMQVVVLPLMGSQVVSQFPEASHLLLPGLAGSIALVACGQIALVAIWRLLTLTSREQAFHGKAVRSMTTIIWAAAVAAVLSLAALAVLAFHQTLPPSVFILLVVTGTGAIAAVLLVSVLRHLLIQAVNAEAELSEVI